MMICVAVVAINWYSAREKRDKIYCTFRRRNKQKIAKWVSMKDTHVVFDHMQFNVVSRCVTFQYFTGGLFGWLNPMFVATLDYDASNEDPFNPDDLSESRIITPRVRKTINNEDRMAAFARGVNIQAGKKKGGIADLLPWIAVLGLVIVGFFVYQDHQNQQILISQMQQIQATLKSIVK